METLEQRHQRQFEQLRRVAECGMEAVEAASLRLKAELAADTPPEIAPKNDPITALAKASAIVHKTIELERRLEAQIEGIAARPAAKPGKEAPLRRPLNPRRDKLRTFLARHLKAEPDRAARAQLARDIDERIEIELEADPEAAILMGDIVMSICEELGLPFSAKLLPDEFLGITKVIIPPDYKPNFDDDPLPPFVPE